MDLEMKMKEDIGRGVNFKGEHLIIENVFSCYEGDFYEVVYQSGDRRRINIWSEEGIEFVRAIT